VNNIGGNAGPITPKALANCSPGLELATTLGIKYQNNDPTLKGLNLARIERGETLSGLSNYFVIVTQGCRSAPTLGCN
jgi:hypothetical protein